MTFFLYWVGATFTLGLIEPKQRFLIVFLSMLLWPLTLGEIVRERFLK
jgi:hypothetical protein